MNVEELDRQIYLYEQQCLLKGELFREEERTLYELKMERLHRQSVSQIVLQLVAFGLGLLGLYFALWDGDYAKGLFMMWVSFEIRLEVFGLHMRGLGYG